MLGKTSIPSVKSATPSALSLTETQRLNGLLNNTRETMQGVVPSTAYSQGVTLCKALRERKPQVKVLLVFKHIRQGRYQLYGNFTTNVLLDCMRQYEMDNTVTMREHEHAERKKTIETASLDVRRLIDDLNRDGKLRNSRKLLNRKYIPYPNDKEDVESTQQAAQETQQETRTETNKTRATS